MTDLSSVRYGNYEIKGEFLVKDDRVLKGPLGRSLRSLARTAHSAHSLHSALLRYICFVRSLHARACSLTLLTFLVGQLKFLNMCSHCYRVSREQTRFWRSLETRPMIMNEMTSNMNDERDEFSYDFIRFQRFFTRA